MKRKYKVLMYGNIIVDFALLERGIYEASQPTLYGEDDTIDELAKRYRSIMDVIQSPPHDRLITNLLKCELREVELRVLDNE